MGVPVFENLATDVPYPPFNFKDHSASAMKRFAGNVI